MNPVIEIRGLSKRYGPVLAVDGLDLRVEEGEIYGFLGLNGAGKTTTIRALLGMIRPNSGSIRLLGQPVGRGGRGPWSKVGHLVETSVAYPELTVHENLEIAGRLHGLQDPHLVKQVISRLRLEPYAERRAGQLSLGNLQRLGLARALLHSPRLLILDEPANGLDPAGLAEIRELLASLAHVQGVTILMSSHNLPEVDRLAGRIGIIHKGKLIEELDSESMERLRAHRLEIQSRDLPAAAAALRTAGYQVREEMEQGRLLLFEKNAIESPDEIARFLVTVGAAPTRLAVEQEELEHHFLRLTGGAQ
jgi:ABC-2 type transport system ATP-binding protein